MKIIVNELTTRQAEFLREEDVVYTSTLDMKCDSFTIRKILKVLFDNCKLSGFHRVRMVLSGPRIGKKGIDKITKAEFDKCYDFVIEHGNSETFKFDYATFLEVYEIEIFVDKRKENK